MIRLNKPLPLLLFCFAALSSCMGPSMEDQLINEEGESWQLRKSFLLKDENDSSLITNYGEQEPWQQEAAPGFSLEFKADGHLYYTMELEDEKASLEEKGHWAYTDDRLNFHPQAEYFDAHDSNQQWLVHHINKRELLLVRKLANGDSLYMSFKKQSAPGEKQQ